MCFVFPRLLALDRRSEREPKFIRVSLWQIALHGALQLLQSIEYNTHVTFEIRDDLCDVLRVRDDLNALIVRVVTNGEWTFD